MELKFLSGVKRHLHKKIIKNKHSKRTLQHKPNLPEIPHKYVNILEDLREHGVAVSSIDKLILPGSKTALLGLDRLFEKIEHKYPSEGEYAVQATQAMIEEEPEVLLFGLDPSLLALAEHYIGLPISYRGLTVRRDCANGYRFGTRMWHCDDEDAAILKIIVYLNNISLQTGPFQYIPYRNSPLEWKIPLINSSRVSDADMERLVPKSNWIPCVGPRGTVVIVDTCRVYHRGMLPLSEDRKAAFFSYNSSEPLNPRWCQPLFDRKEFMVRNQLNQRQLAALGYMD